MSARASLGSAERRESFFRLLSVVGVIGLASAGCVRDLPAPEREQAPATPPRDEYPRPAPYVIAPTVDEQARPVVRRPGQAPSTACGGGELRVHFYDVGQGLAVLVELPDGQLILVDAGESPSRPGCGEACATWHSHFMEKLRKDVRSRGIDLLWVTHPHSDHMGGAEAVLNAFPVRAYADNGTRRNVATVSRTVDVAKQRGVTMLVASPDAPSKALREHPGVRVTGLVPASWPMNCETQPNDCSAGLRIDFCHSSVVLVGDAEEAEEEVLPGVERADVLQVGHHGSETSTSMEFLNRVQPAWAVVSSAKPNEGTNKTYCHPRAGAVARLSSVLGDQQGPPVTAFSGTSCRNGRPEEWGSVSTSSRIFFTSRDGDVVLVTTGDGEFVRDLR